MVLTMTKQKDAEMWQDPTVFDVASSERSLVLERARASVKPTRAHIVYRPMVRLLAAWEKETAPQKQVTAEAEARLVGPEGEPLVPELADFLRRPNRWKPLHAELSALVRYWNGEPGASAPATWDCVEARRILAEWTE